jgi:hypothetical protein
MISHRIQERAVGVFAEVYFFEYVAIVEIVYFRWRFRGQGQGISPRMSIYFTGFHSDVNSLTS